MSTKQIIWVIIVIAATGLLIYGIWGKKSTDVESLEQNAAINAGPQTPPAETPVVGTQDNLKVTNKKMTDIKEFSFDVLKEGTGAQAKTNDNVTVTYKGMFLDGKVFDQGQFPFTLGVGQVVAGFDKGVMGMKVGESRKIYIPSDMGYGARGAGAAIPPNTDLIFEVTLDSIK